MMNNQYASRVFPEKLFSSKNRTKASLGKKLKNDMLPEIEKLHKRKENFVKNNRGKLFCWINCVNMDGLAGAKRLKQLITKLLSEENFHPKQCTSIPL